MAATPAGSPRARQPEALLGWMESLADPTRLRLLRLLARHELGVAELCHVLQLPQSTVSRHLKILGDEGWLRGRAQATTRLYRMATEQEPAARRLWALAKEQTEAWAAVRQDALRLSRWLEDRQPAAQSFFAGAAGKWDKLREELYGKAFLGEALLELVPSGWVVADLGCGTAPAAVALAPRVARVIGVDQSTAMLNAARRRTAGLSNVELRPGDLLALPLPGASVDAALMILALTYVSDPARAVAEMARIVRPGGRAVVLDLLRHDDEEFRGRMGQESLGFEPEQLAALMKDAGLQGARARVLPPESGAKGPALLLASGTRAAPPQTTGPGTRDLIEI